MDANEIEAGEERQGDRDEDKEYKSTSEEDDAWNAECACHGCLSWFTLDLSYVDTVVDAVEDDEDDTQVGRERRSGDRR